MGDTFFPQDAASVFKLTIFVQLTVNFLKLKISDTELSSYTYQSCDPNSQQYRPLSFLGDELTNFEDHICELRGEELYER